MGNQPKFDTNKQQTRNMSRSVFIVLVLAIAAATDATESLSDVVPESAETQETLVQEMENEGRFNMPIVWPSRKKNGNKKRNNKKSVSRCKKSRKTTRGGFGMDFGFGKGSVNDDAPKFLGCFKDDDENRDLKGKKFLRETSLEDCNTKCKGYKYFGRQYHQECFCGNSYGKHGEICPGQKGYCDCGTGWHIKNIGANKNCVYEVKK